jgi:hypothetical protein
MSTEPDVRSSIGMTPVPGRIEGMRGASEAVIREAILTAFSLRASALGR